MADAEVNDVAPEALNNGENGNYFKSMGYEKLEILKIR